MSAAARHPLEGPRLLIAQQVLAAVALDPALDGLEQVGPHRLRTEIAAPDASRDRVHQEQRHRGEDEQPGEVVDFLRPDFDEEEVEAPVRKVEQHRLTGRVRPAVPAHERKPVIDAERDEQHDPFDPAEGARDALRIDLAACDVERPFLVGLGHHRRCCRPRSSVRRILDQPEQRRLRRAGGMEIDSAAAHRLFLPAAERMHVNCQRLDGGVVEPAGPARHHAAAAVPDPLHDRGLVGAEQPDGVGQARRPELAFAVAVLAVADGAIVERRASCRPRGRSCGRPASPASCRA